MCTEEIFQTIAKIVLILTDIGTKEEKGNLLFEEISYFSFMEWEQTNEKVISNFVKHRENFNLFTDVEYTHTQDTINIYNKHEEKDYILILPCKLAKSFIASLKMNFQFLYSIVWLNWTDPKYDIKFL